MTRRWPAALIAGGGLAVLTLGVAAGQAPAPAGAVVPALLRDFVPVTDEMLLRPEPENWISFRNGYNLWGYSSLDEIDASSVGELRLVWSRAMQHGYQEVEPIVYNGVMFLPNVEDIVQALDATTGDLLWEYRRALPDNVANVTGTRYRYRNVSIYDDKVFLATNDAFLVALDVRTGDVVWETQRADYSEQVAQTTGPLVIGGKLVTGSRCNPQSPRPGGWLHHRSRSRDRPRAVAGEHGRHAGPGGRRHLGRPAGVGPPPRVAVDDRQLRSGAEPPLLGHRTPSPLPEKLRGAGKADLLYTNSTLALDPDTGELMWYFQHLPRDNWDLDHVFERLIVETTVAPDPAEVPWINPALRSGETRKVITGVPGKTGVVWTLDAATGEFLWARPTIYQNIMTGLDLETGRPIIDESTTPQSVEDFVLACPHLFGGKNQPSGAYSPDTGAMYMPMNNACMDLAMSVEVAGPSDGYDVRTRMRHVPDVDPATAAIGRIEAVSASTGKTLWSYQQRAAIYGSVLTTGGNLVFAGDVVRRFRAFDAETGDVLWQTILNGPVGGRPMTYRAGGRQYIAIAAGGLAIGSAFLGLTPELTTPSGSNTLFVFALPERR